MSPKQKMSTISIILLLHSIGSAYPQRRVPEDQIKLGERFFKARDKCNGFLRGKQWGEAEIACKAAVGLADRFADHRELEKMGAYEGVGSSLMGQGRYREAIASYSRALEVARPRVDDTDAEAGRVYASIAMAHHAMRDLGKAREFYRKAASTYRVAYADIDPEADYGVEMRRGYMRMLKIILEHHLLAAEESGEPAEVEEIQKQIAALPK